MLIAIDSEHNRLLIRGAVPVSQCFGGAV